MILSVACTAQYQMLGQIVITGKDIEESSHNLISDTILTMVARVLGSTRKPVSRAHLWSKIQNLEFPNTRQQYCPLNCNVDPTNQQGSFDLKQTSRPYFRSCVIRK